MKKFMLLLAMVTFVASLAYAADPPAEVKYETKMGTVTFSHPAHQGKVPDCTTCHHKGLEAGACKTCHNDGAAVNAKKAYHGQCKDCHAKEGGPAGCKDCHVK